MIDNLCYFLQSCIGIAESQIFRWRKWLRHARTWNMLIWVAASILLTQPSKQCVKTVLKSTTL